MRRLREAIKLAAYVVVVAVGIMTLWQGLWPHHEPPQPPTLGSIPACDDDAPGRPVTGPCWLLDDDGPDGQRRISVWPYPYAPTPLAVLAGSG